MDNPGEILHLCRLCLVKDEVDVPIFEEQSDIKQIFLKISSCLPVKVSREDRLPKSICSNCSDKLDSFYEFWSSSANAEKTLLSWLDQQDKEALVQKVKLESAKPETVVKKESLVLEETVEESTKDQDVPPPAKRARRTASVVANVSISQEAEDEDLDTPEFVTKVEEECEETEGEDKNPNDTEVSEATEGDDQEAGPSRVNEEGAQAISETIYLEVEEPPAAAAKPPTPKPANLTGVFFWCHICGRCFARKLELNKHFAFVHFGDKQHHCKYCGVSYKEESSLLKHQKLRHSAEIRIEDILCHECGTTFKTEKALDKHIVSAHSSAEAITCEWCHEDFATESAFKVHFKVHSREPVKSCDRCQESFYSLHQYRYHMKTRHRDTFLVCSACNKLFPTLTRLRQHEKVHKEDHESRDVEECTLCHKKVRNLEAHIENVHPSEDKSFVCDVCGRPFRSFSFLKKHMDNHT